MATIRVAVTRDFKIRDLPVFESMHLMFRRYSSICNLKFVGNTQWHILYKTIRTSKKIWAQAPIYNWGVGRVEFNVASWILPRYTKEIVDSLMFHETGHILAYTYNQDISYPPAKWLVDRLVGHWGPPIKGIRKPKLTEGKTFYKKPQFVVVVPYIGEK